MKNNYLTLETFRLYSSTITYRHLCIVINQLAIQHKGHEGTIEILSHSYFGQTQKSQLATLSNCCRHHFFLYVLFSSRINWKQWCHVQTQPLSLRFLLMVAIVIHLEKQRNFHSILSSIFSLSFHRCFLEDLPLPTLFLSSIAWASSPGKVLQLDSVYCLKFTP